MEAEQVSSYEWQPSLNDTVATISVGSPTAEYDESAHFYTIWNNASTNRNIVIVVRTPNTSVVNRTVRLPPNTVARINVREPDNYRTNVTVLEENAIVSRLSIIDERGNFDCNTKNINIALLADRHVGVSTDTTLVACGTTTEPDTTVR